MTSHEKITKPNTMKTLTEFKKGQIVICVNDIHNKQENSDWKKIDKINIGDELIVDEPNVYCNKWAKFHSKKYWHYINSFKLK